MEQPVLRLGLIGFSPEDKFKVAQAICLPDTGWPSWELVEFEHADAWCINGAAVERLDGNRVKVRTLLVTQPIISLDPSEIKRPIAFTAPMPEGLEATEMVSFKTPQLMRVGLQRFEAWLRPLRAQFALGSELVAREHELKQGVYHVLDVHGKLLAVVNFKKWSVALFPLAKPADFENATWVQRPGMAAATPPGFTVTTVAHLMWAYAVRTAQDALPSRYRKQAIYLRRVPALPPGWLQDEHLTVLRALSSDPDNFTQLMQTTQLTDSTLSSALAALYFAGAITTRRESAGYVEYMRSPVGDQNSLPFDSQTSGYSPSELGDSGGQSKIRAGYAGSKSDATAPAPLFIAKFS